MNSQFSYGSLCSGIEAATVAWHTLGWKPAWFSEIEKFPSKVLQHLYSHVPNIGDMTKIRENEIFHQSTVDLIVGGTPCQSFSVAGLRKGLDDERGNLALEYCRILIAKRPRWFIWENVPGALSSFTDEAEDQEAETIIQSADFATLCAAFRECGYSFAYRILDAQYFGVPQRRRRVFVIGYFGNDWRPPAAVLFERESLSRDFETLYKQRKDAAISARAGATATVYDTTQISSPINGSNPKPETCHTISKGTHAPLLVKSCFWDVCPPSQTIDRVVAKGQMMPEKQRFPAVIQSVYGADLSGRDIHYNVEVAPTIAGIKHAGHGYHVIQSVDCRNLVTNEEISGTLQSKSTGGYSLNYQNPVLQNYIVRRLTPLECERLQGFPDGYTNIPGAKDTPRYQALGNSMAVPVMRWIGERIQIVEEILKHKL
jgi:DNA (cytosine-5)-methyltransferase 1